MRILGELCLLAAFVGSGFAAFACLAAGARWRRTMRTAGLVSATASMLALTAAVVVLSWALATRDYRFAYVGRYASNLLPRYYCLSALWVGQAGSLLVWAWLSGAVALLLRLLPGRQPGRLQETAFGILMACLCVLVAIIVFAADPMTPSIGRVDDGAGLSPLLQHPAMLIHPPVVFLGYALWGIPFALAIAAGAFGRFDTSWVRQVRAWALAAWAVSGVGILLGAQWAYEELGWGGYWSWDPVENGSLVPWLTGTALIHVLMTWHYRGAFKKTGVFLAVATFGLCQFATFLTRSGIFSSVHAFGQSSIGWFFLIATFGLIAAGGALVAVRREALAPDWADENARKMGTGTARCGAHLSVKIQDVAEPAPIFLTPAPDRSIRRVLSREALVLLSVAALLLIAAATVAGTVVTNLSRVLVGRSVAVGPAFYNSVLIPTGLVLLGATAMAPLLRWGAAPTTNQRKGLLLSAGAGSIAAAIGWAVGALPAIELAVVGSVVFAVGALATAVALDARRRGPGRPWYGLYRVFRDGRRPYAGFMIHLGFACLAMGVVGSSLRTTRQQLVMRPGQTVHWGGRTVRLVRVLQRKTPGKLVAEAELEISEGDGRRSTLLPAQHFHVPQQNWTTEVAIRSAWRGDLYAIFEGVEDNGGVRLTLIDNPMMRWLWSGGWVMGFGALIRLWPARRRWVEAAVAASSASQPADRRRDGEAATLAIRARRLSKDFADRRVLHQIDLDVPAGQCVGLLGVNGAGKTTLLRCLAAAIRPTEGEVRWFGRPAGDGPASRRVLGMVGHDGCLYPHLTLRENLLFAARMCGMRKPHPKADQLLRRMALGSRGDLLPTQVSRGVRQRLAVARALVHDPQILLLDEPFAGLDVAGSDWLIETLGDLHDAGCTICFATHDEAIARRLADRIFQLRAGRLIDATTREGTRAGDGLVGARVA